MGRNEEQLNKVTMSVHTKKRKDRKPVISKGASASTEPGKAGSTGGRARTSSIKGVPLTPITPPSTKSKPQIHNNQDTAQQAGTRGGPNPYDTGFRSPQTNPSSSGEASEHMMLIPAKVDRVLIQLAAKEAPRFLDHLRFIAHSITYRRLTDTRFKGESTYVKLAHRYLHKFISKDFTAKFLQLLDEAGIIETDGLWIAGAYAKGYRFQKSFRDDSIVYVPITDKLLKKKLEQFLQEHLFQQVSGSPGYKHVERWLQELRIDPDLALECLRASHPVESYKFSLGQMAVHALVHRRHWFIRGPRSQRAYNNLTNLPRELRPFLSILGQTLHQVDIRNSQPLFLYLVLRDRPGIPAHERLAMEQALLSGTFYEILNTLGLDRDTFKKAFYRDVLFGRGNYSTAVTLRFAECYSNYAAEIARIKEVDHRCMAAMLQAEEASVVFEAVERFANLTHEQVPILTIHDSLVTTSEHLDLAAQVLKDVFQTRYGLAPSINIK